jgi:hypothetical protein
VSVDKIVRGVQLTLEEPGNVTMLETTGRDGLKVTVPSKQLMGEITKELIRVLNRLLVELFVVFETINMRLRRVLTVIVVRRLIAFPRLQNNLLEEGLRSGSRNNVVSFVDDGLSHYSAVLKYAESATSEKRCIYMKLS